MPIELARSGDLKLVHEYEVVWLEDGHKKTVVGDHYGDPVGGLIDEHNKWCASYGEGIVVYFLREPLVPFGRATPSNQWCEWGRDGQPKYVRSVRQIGPFDLEVTLDESSKASSQTLRLRISEGRVDFVSARTDRS